MAAASDALPDAPAATAHPRGYAAVIAVLCIGPFMSVLDLTLVNIILPHIAGGYGATPTEATLIVTFFAIAQAISMPLSGALAQRFGVVRMFLISMTAFALSSFLCGAAPSLGMLILARIFQGLAAGPVVPLSQAILQRILPSHRLASALSLFGVAMMTGPLVGPALGGMLADTIGWRWGFFVNLPIALVCLVASLRMFPKHETPRVRVPIDGVGLGLMVVWITALQIVLDKGRDFEWFSSPLIVWLTVLAVVTFVAFLIWELTDAHPIVDLSVFRHRGFAVTSVVTAYTYAIATGGSLMIYLWLQTDMNYDATHAGYVSAITGAPGILIAPIAAWLSTRVDPRVLASCGLAGTTVAFLLRTQFTHDADFFHVMVPQIFIGISAIFFWGPLITLAMVQVPRHQIPAAAGILTFTRTLALGVTVALLINGWDRGAKTGHEIMASSLNDTQAITRPLEQATLTSEQSIWAVNSIVTTEGTMFSLHRMFWVLALLMLSGIVLVWFAPLRKSAVQDPPSPAPLVE